MIANDTLSLRRDRKEKNSMEEIISLISNVGFPCFMCVYVVTRLEPAINTLTQSVNTLVNIVKNYHNE